MLKLTEKNPVAYQPNDICCPKIRLEGITKVAQQSIFEKLSVPTQYAGELQYNEHEMLSTGGRSEGSHDLTETVINLGPN